MTALFLSAALFAASTLPPPHEAAVAKHFCEAMTSGRLREFAGVTEDPVMLAEWSWESVRDLVAGYDCISVSSYATTFNAETRTLVIDVDGSGITRNSRRERRTIPPRWYLTLDAAGNVARVDDDRTKAARAMLDAASDTERAAIAETHRDSMAAIARTIAVDAPHESPDAVRAAATCLLERGEDADTLTYALCALARALKRAHDKSAGSFAELARSAASRGSCDAMMMADYTAADFDPQRAALLESVAAAADAVDDPRTSFAAAYDRGFDALGVSDIPTGIRTFENAEAAARRLGQRDSELDALYGRIAVATTVSDPTAVERARKCGALAADAGYSNIASRAWSLVAFIARDIDGYENALRYAPKAATGLKAFNHANLAVRLERAGRISEAAAHLPPAFEAMKASPSYATNVYWAAMIVWRAQGKIKEAIDAAHTAIESNDSPLQITWGLKHELGEMLIECGDVESGIEELRESIDLIEARRVLTTSNPIIRAEYMQSRAQIYTVLAATLVAQKRYEEALEVSEQIKARAMADAVAVRGQSLALSESEAADEKALNQRIVDLNRALIAARNRDAEAAIRQRLHAARSDLDSFQITLEARHTRGEATHSTGGLETLAANFHGTAIEYEMLDQYPVLAFVVRNGRVQARRLDASSTAIEEQVRLLGDRIEQRNLNASAPARALYSMLIAPIADLLPHSGDLTFIPDGALWALPFQLLRTPRGHYLLQDYAVAYAPSVTALERAASRPARDQRRKTLLALGDPYIAAPTTMKAATYRNLHLGALPDAKKEVRAIGNLYGRVHSTVVTGDSARESLLKRVARHYRILHLATHGIVDDDSPLYSALVLATGAHDPDDGLLEMREISDLDLDADLVVLSACDTARGTVLRGEGIVGLSWAFLSAGCPTTVVSQWRTDSRATSLLMIEFHRQLEQHRSIAEALRRAELKLMRTTRYHHPFYWAPFIVVGRVAPLTLR